MKFDRQIVAIAKVEGAERIYSNDGDIRRIGTGDGIEVIMLDGLALPPAVTPDLFNFERK